MTNRIALPTPRLAAAIAAALLAVSLPSPARAQGNALDPRWQGWLGCWRPAVTPLASTSDIDTLGTRIVDAYAPLLCVVPSADETSIEMVTVTDGRIVGRETIDASGAERSKTRDGCTGIESAHWSGDARRVYLRSEYSCPGALARKSNGVLAISTEGELLDVQGVVTGAGKSVRVARYRDAGQPSSLPVSIADAIGGRAMAIGASRTAASAPITATEIIDASRNLDAPVVHAWLNESGQSFSVNAKAITGLAAAGVPSGVTDILVALSYPRVFAVNRATFASDLRAPVAGGATLAGGPRTIYADVYPPNVGGYYNGYYSPYYSNYSPFGYSPFGYGGYGGYGSYPYGSAPVIVIREGAAAQHGRVVNGRGYSRHDGSDASSSGSEPRSAKPTTSASSGSSSSGSSGSSSSSGSSETHKAKPRP